MIIITFRRNLFLHRQLIHDRNINCYYNLVNKYTDTYADLVSEGNVINPWLVLKLKKWILNTEKQNVSSTNYTKINDKIIVTNRNKNFSVLIKGKVLLLMVALDTYYCHRKRVELITQAFSKWIRLNTNIIITTCIQKIFRGKYLTTQILILILVLTLILIKDTLLDSDRFLST